ncbi:MULTISPECIES: glycosyltransferase [unclassified Caballeronia]|uniref:glycosyltransferase n=1 Tax=unclassified Caballeronia TaxID=2646786 RepID=UPI002027E984|nr:MULTISPECIES: glycosyltransferase [unclassified Caballeronia]
MFNSVYEKPLHYAHPWDLNFERRYEALMKRPRRVAYFYEKPDSTTFRYRVFNMSQALEADTVADVSASWFFREDMPHMARIVDRVDALVFCRTHFSPSIGALIDRARRRGVRVLFDVDDLVFDTDYVHLILSSLDQDANNESALNGWFASIARQGTLLKMCDGAIVTNAFLGDRIRAFAPSLPVSTVPNFLNRDQQAISERMFEQKQERDFESSQPFHIGYFSGTPTHRRDFDIAAPALARLLRDDSRLRLLIVGALESAAILKPYKHRIDRYPLQDYMNLQRLIARTELNIGPLLDNPFTNCKSELKFFEAAITGTVTIASPTYAFRQAISDGVTGLLSRSHEWHTKLERAVELLDDRQRYANMSVAAYEHARNVYGWNRQTAAIQRALFGNAAEQRLTQTDGKAEVSVAT